MLNRKFGYVFLLALLASSAAVGAEYKGPLDVPAKVNTKFAQSNRLTAVAKAGNALVAVGPRGHILVSENSGQSWEQVPVPVSSDLVAVRFVNATHGWAVGHDGVVLHTADAGKSWVKQLDGKQAAAVAEKSFKKAVAEGSEQAKKSQDLVTRFVEEGADKPFLDVLFLNEKEGFVVGAFNNAFRTQDGGKTWEPLFWQIDNPQSYHLYALATHAGELYAAGERGLLLHWDRQRQYFSAITSPYQGSFFGLLDTGKELIAYGLRGNVYATADGAKTWRKIDTPAPDSVVGGALLGAHYALVTVGGRILLNKSDGSGFDVIPASSPMQYASVAAASDHSLVAAGARGVRVETIRDQAIQEK
ncbi:MAG TPA: YCF48-related protein [Noviherbaspirillum sp.]|uniref:YCF48-related protein n=1 Tax=Noviherbaspirillum sp. TaxID=1926288 RepID=UPI002B488189|nr:YCF48-related protein [Noviherbaspirillum sp.]HJV86581.1 YCF48-related protein [Noviherbaspirillum sp.]